MDRQQLAQEQLADVKILQKVNAVHRNAFAEKFPGQVDHCLRLVMERLQAGLDKRDGCDISDPSTWKMSTIELSELAQTAYHLHEIKTAIK